MPNFTVTLYTLGLCLFTVISQNICVILLPRWKAPVHQYLYINMPFCRTIILSIDITHLTCKKLKNKAKLLLVDGHLTSNNGRYRTLFSLKKTVFFEVDARHEAGSGADWTFNGNLIC